MRLHHGGLCLRSLYVSAALLFPSEEHFHTGLFCYQVLLLVLTLHSKTFHLVISSYQLQAIIRFTQEQLCFTALCNLAYNFTLVE